MRRAALVAAVLAMLVASGCGGGSDDSQKAASSGTPAGGGAKQASGNITLWVGFTERELGVVKDVVKDFEQSHPNIKVKVVGGISDDKIIASIRGGNAPDVAQSFTADNTGAFCNSGGWIDLKPYLQRDKIDESMFGATSAEYTKYKDTRCALPMLADVYGLYYNKKLFKQAGITAPPKTMSELSADAKKLTQRNPDGSLKVVGFNPTWGWYEMVHAHAAPSFGAKWTDASGKSVLGSDPAWARMLRWQKQLVDYYGFDNLQRFKSRAGDEWAASNAFETGKVAMNIDGEYRTAFIAKEHPELDYGTAPMPVDD